MQNLFQLGMRDAELLAPNRGQAPDGGVLQRVAKGYPPTIPVAPMITRRSWPTVGTFIDDPAALLVSSHDRGRSSIQSTYSRRSANRHAPSCFTKVS